MRVISGVAKGGLLQSVPGVGTRPTTDKVKEALFSMIGPYFQGGWVLDLFAGTGGLGIEALSRGAEQAVFVDYDLKAIQVIKRNLKMSRLTGQSEVYRNEANGAIKVLAKRNIEFTLIFLDPPYRMKEIDKLLLNMWNLKLLAQQAVIVIEHHAKDEYPAVIASLSRWKQAHYGEVGLTVYRVVDQKEIADDGRC